MKYIRLVILSLAFLGLSCSTQTSSSSQKPQSVTMENNPSETNQTEKVDKGTNINIPSPQGASSKREYQIVVDAPKEAKVGEEVNVVVTLTPSAGLKVNEEFPHKLTVAEIPVGVDCPKKEFLAGAGEGKADAEKFAPELASFVVACTASEAGVKDFSGEYRFSVCNDNHCATPKEKLAWRIDVK